MALTTTSAGIALSDSFSQALIASSCLGPNSPMCCLQASRTISRSSEDGGKELTTGSGLDSVSVSVSVPVPVSVSVSVSAIEGVSHRVSDRVFDRVFDRVSEGYSYGL